MALVDFDNDCIGTALRCADTLSGDKLWGVRLDTSENMVDQVHPAASWAASNPTGLCRSWSA